MIHLSTDICCWWWELWCQFKCCSFVSNLFFLSGYFQYFLSIFLVMYFHYDVSRCGFLFIFYSWICHVFYKEHGKFLAIIFRYSLSHSLFSCSKTCIRNMLCFLILPSTFLKLSCVFFQLCLFLSCHLGNILRTVFQFANPLFSYI